MTGRPRWLTPDTAPADNTCRVLFIPDDVGWLAIVAGAILELTNPYNFEDFGTASAQDTADKFQNMFDLFAFEQGTCRVIGEIILWSTSSSPDANWLPCDGSSLLRADYPDLFAVIGVVYGTVDGTHFNVPDLRGRVPVGIGTGTGLSTYSIGGIAGEEAHTLIVSELASHSHTDTGHSHTDLGHSHTEVTALPILQAIGAGVPAPAAVPGIGITGIGSSNIANGSANITASGSGNAHENRQPSLALNYLIVAR